MQTKHISYDKAFKVEAMRLVQTGGKSMNQVSKELGVADSSLNRWCQEYDQQGERAFVGSDPRALQYPFSTWTTALLALAGNKDIAIMGQCPTAILSGWPDR